MCRVCTYLLTWSLQVLPRQYLDTYDWLCCPHSARLSVLFLPQSMYDYMYLSMYVHKCELRCCTCSWQSTQGSVLLGSGQTLTSIIGFYICCSQIQKEKRKKQEEIHPYPGMIRSSCNHMTSKAESGAWHVLLITLLRRQGWLQRWDQWRLKLARPASSHPVRIPPTREVVPGSWVYEYIHVYLRFRAGTDMTKLNVGRVTAPKGDSAHVEIVLL